MKRLWAILLVMVLSFASLLCAGEGPVPFKESAVKTSSQMTLADIRAIMEDQANPSAQPVKHRHWTKGGKIMTFIGVPVMGAGGAMMAYGMRNGNSTSCSGSTCVSVDWKWSGVAWVSVGGVLTAIGATRRSSQ